MEAILKMYRRGVLNWTQAKYRIIDLGLNLTDEQISKLLSEEE